MQSRGRNSTPIAALLALALPGRPVRVQWMREQEHSWEPYGSAMLTNVRAALDEKGQIIFRDYTVRSIRIQRGKVAPAI
jgi:hypothetical protein